MVTGLLAIGRSRTAQAKNAERDARKRRTDDSASPDWFRGTGTRWRGGFRSARG